MDPIEIAAGLAEFEGRAPGTDAERRASVWLGRRLREIGREVQVEPEWVRPQAAIVGALHAGLGVVGGLVALTYPTVGLAVLALTTLSATLDLLGVAHLARRITPERATQNLVSPPTAATRSGAQRIVRLVIVAHYDAPRTGIAYRQGPRRIAAFAQRLARGYLPGATSVAAIGPALLLLAAGARRAGIEGRWLDIVQLVPTLALLVALALLIDLALAPTGPGAGDPGSAAGVALELAAALDSSPPNHLAVELVLAGAGQGPSLGMRGYVRRRRRLYAPEATAVLHLEGCGRGHPRWWTVDGPLVPLRMHPRLVALAAEAAREHPELRAAAHRGHRAGAGWRARQARWPTITVGCLDERGITPDSGTAADVPEQLEEAAMRDALTFCRALVERLDADLARRAA
jgi:hypothetical protein